MRLYAARDKNTGKLVSGITNPSHKFWQRQGDCEYDVLIKLFKVLGYPGVY